MLNAFAAPGNLSCNIRIRRSAGTCSHTASEISAFPGRVISQFLCLRIPKSYALGSMSVKNRVCVLVSCWFLDRLNPQPKGDAEKLVTRLRFGLIQVPVLQYTDINQISSKLYYDSCWRNFM